MTESPIDIDWSGVSLDTVRQIHSEGQVYLCAQLQAAIAADQRAVTMASILAATAAALLAVGLGVYQIAKDGPTLSACVAAAAMLLLAAACGVWAARPIAFWFPGNTPPSSRPWSPSLFGCWPLLRFLTWWRCLGLVGTLAKR